MPPTVHAPGCPGYRRQPVWGESVRAPLVTARDGLTDPSLRFAILAGLATVPVTLALSWEQLVVPTSAGGVHVGGTVSGLALLVAGLAVGYRYSDRETGSTRAGLWTGLAASVATGVVFLANSFAPLWADAGSLHPLTVILTPVAVAFGVGLTVIVTVVPAVLGDYVTSRIRRAGQSTAASAPEDRQGDPATRWRSLLLYVLLFPVVVLAMVWEAVADWDALVLLTALGALAILALSMYCLFALFTATTAPRPGTATWNPRWWLYAGGPLAVGAVVYVVRVATGSTYPPGDAIYGFMAALWVAAVVYLVQHRRHARRS